MAPTTRFLMLLRRYPTDLHWRLKTRHILTRLAA